MPHKWYTKYMAEMRQTPAGCHMVITAEDIRLKKTMHNPSPHVSPYNSDAEEEAGDASDIDSMDSDASVPENDDLEFGKEYEIDKEE